MQRDYRRALRGALLASSSVLVTATLPAIADIYSVGGGTIATTQSDSNIDSTGSGGGFLLQPNTVTGGDTLAISGVSIVNTAGGANGRALDLGYSLPSSGEYSVFMSGSTLNGNVASGTAAFLASTSTGAITFDSTGGTPNVISGAIGITVSASSSVVIKTGADTITTSGATGEILYGVSGGTVSIDSIGATLTSSGRYGIVASAQGDVTIGGLNGGIQSAVNVANGYGIFITTPGLSNFITLGNNGVINAQTGIYGGGPYTTTVDTFGTINASVTAIVANIITLENGSVTKGVILGGDSGFTGDVFNIVAGADISNATFNGGAGTDTINLVGAGNATISLSTISNIEILQKSGAGTWTLTNSGGAASYNVVAGSVRLAAGANLASASSLSVNGGTFDLNGNSQVVAGLSGAGGIVLLGTGALTANVSANSTLASVISGAGSFTKGGAGTLVLTGANTYIGGTTINAGTLQIGNGGGLAPTGALTVNGGVFDLNGATQTVAALSGTGGSIFLGSGALVTNSNSNSVLAADISGTGSLAKSGTGILILTGANTYAGGTAINGGTLQIGSGGATGSIGGNVADNGVLAFNRSDTVSFAGVISGSGSLEQVGTGTLTLGGANTYTGGTVVSAGTLRIGSGGALASAGALAVNGGTFDLNGAVQSVGALSGTGGSILLGSGVLTTNSNSDTTLASVIGGAGAFAKAGSGALTLAATNTYTGATNVTSGALNVTGSIASSSGVTVASGAALTGTGTVSSTTIQSGGTLSAGGASVGTLNVSGDLTLNSGAITQVDVTTTAADKLAVSGAAAIDGTLNVAFASGSYVPTQYTIITSTGALSGTFYSLNLTGAPSGLATGLVYDANNVFLKLVTGFSANANFNIDAGTVNVNGNQTTGGISGTGGTINIAGTSLTNNQTGASTFAGAFAGSGVFTETGSGTLILNGNSSDFAGTTTVGGSLQVGDAAHPGASLGGTVNVNQGGTLGGHGTVIGSVTNAGVTAPGGSIGTLTVAGNYSVASGASLQQEVAANGAADLLKVGGVVSIAGNTTLQVLAADPVSSYARVTNYTVVTGAGGISGSFTNVTSTAGLTSIVSYAPGAVNLTVVRNDISLATLATTANQAGVGAAISADPGSALFAAVAPLGNAQMPSVLASLSGEIHASVRSAAIEDGRILRQSVLDELAADPQSATAVWGSLFASSGHIDNDGNGATVNHTNGGGIVGIDTMLGGGLRAGVAGAYSRHSVSVVDRASHASGTSGHVLAYAGWSDAALHLRAGVDFGWGGDDILRNVGQLAETNASHQNLSTAQIFGEAGYSFQTGLGALEPYAQIAWLEARSGNFVETGGALSSLRGRAASNAVAYGGFGLRARFRAVDLGDGMNLTPHLELGLQHAFNTFLPSQTLLVGAGSFLASGVSLPGDAATVGAGIDLALSPAARLSIGYDGALASQAQNHAVRAQIRWALQ